MPPVSEAQKKAMFAAAAGHSNLGIPQAVAKEFVGKDAKARAAGTMFVAPDGDVLLLRRSGEGDHKGEWCLPGGMVEGDETDDEAARREATEEIGIVPPGKRRLLDRRVNGVGFTTFAQAVPEKFTPTLNGEHTGYAWAGLHELPQPLHPGLADMLTDQLGRERSAADMTPNDWDGLVKGFLKWIDEEETEGEHAEDGKLAKADVHYAEGKGDDRCRACAHFEKPAACELVAGEIDPAYWCEKFERVAAAAQDEALIEVESFDRFAFDRESVRYYDADGRMHVERTPISKANICEYRGGEIPNSEQLGLEPMRKYRLLRHPDELRRGADTFNNLPLLRRHVPVSANNPQQGEVIGSTGTDAAFEEPFLTNSLVVWTKDDIEDIESDLRKELSSAYRYRADMTPGTYEGEPYDGVMRDIIGNHVALVREGRAGPDVVVGDSKENVMSNIVLTRKGAVAYGALLAHLAPRMGQDARIDLPSILKPVTAKNWKAERPRIIADVNKALAGKLAKDAKLDGLETVLMALDEAEPAEEKEDEKKDKAEDEDMPDGMDRKAKDRKARDALEDRLGEQVKAKDFKGARDTMAELEKAKDEKDEEDERPDPEDTNKGDKKARDKKAKDAEPEAVTKKAMDEAIAGERQRQRDVREAERFVRPWMGDIAIAYDSADDVYKAALEARGKSTKGLHPSAYRAVLEMLPKPGSERREQRIGMDAAANVDSFGKMFPDALRIGVNQ